MTFDEFFFLGSLILKGQKGSVAIFQHNHH